MEREPAALPLVARVLVATAGATVQQLHDARDTRGRGVPLQLRTLIEGDTEGRACGTLWVEECELLDADYVAFRALADLIRRVARDTLPEVQVDG